MILKYFNLREQPFGTTPDSRFWFAGSTHREALDSVLYGLQSRRGFVALIARPGMGKTAVLHEGLRRLGDTVRAVFLAQPPAGAKSLLQAALAGLGVKTTQGDLIRLQRRLRHLCAEQGQLGRRVVLVIDAAHNLDEPVLEFVRKLSDLESDEEKRVQVVLSGRFLLAEKLAGDRLVQLRQRISILAHLKPLSEGETAAYIAHRLRIAGARSLHALFAPAAVAVIAREAQGVPGRINELCLRGLSAGLAHNRKLIDAEMMRAAIADHSLDPPAPGDGVDPQLPAYVFLHGVDRSLPAQSGVLGPLLRRAIDRLMAQTGSGRSAAVAALPTGSAQLHEPPGAVEQAGSLAGRWPGWQWLTSASSRLPAFCSRFHLRYTDRMAGMSLLLAAAASMLFLGHRDQVSAAAARAQTVNQKIALKPAADYGHWVQMDRPIRIPASVRPVAAAERRALPGSVKTP